MNNEENELEVNKKNREDYENLMKESSTKKDMYWDRNNPAVKLVLLLIGTIIFIGSAYFIIKYVTR
ncbi:MAG: hypothetical protein IK137_04330 [Bacilli bacterium]|nr:hypothetical protein [Bacilli bacterium]